MSINLFFLSLHILVINGLPQAIPDASELPNGISKIQQSPTTDYCRQFLNGRVVEANGTQLKTGGQSCSSTPIGQIPTINNMVSTLITQPAYGAALDATLNNTVVLNTKNLDSGFFNNPNTEYYMVPSTLNPQDGNPQGHQHVTVQLLNGNNVPDPKVFGFFKGVNDKEVDEKKETLQAIIPAGAIKVDGTYRICSITGTDGHQSVVSPVVRRGAQDDCIRVTFQNTVGGAQKKIADDSAQNAQITVDGKNSGKTATNDNSGVSGKGEDINKKVEQTAGQGGVDANAANTMKDVETKGKDVKDIKNGTDLSLPAGNAGGSTLTGNKTGQNTGTGGKDLNSIVNQLKGLLSQMQQILGNQ
ncbi:hypothetical protein BC833DRAFT_593093 [Globomyces pollinis-pini]|nr:hypothetical protein BC833DRAFT_593093 [Globomyces pollinis-pini]